MLFSHAFRTNERGIERRNVQITDATSRYAYAIHSGFIFTVHNDR